MSLVSVGTVAFDAIETPFGKTDKIIGGACTYISLAASFFEKGAKIISVVGGDFPQKTLDMFSKKDTYKDFIKEFPIVCNQMLTKDVFNINAFKRMLRSIQHQQSLYNEEKASIKGYNHDQWIRRRADYIRYLYEEGRKKKHLSIIHSDAERIWNQTYEALKMEKNSFKDEYDDTEQKIKEQLVFDRVFKTKSLLSHVKDGSFVLDEDSAEHLLFKVKLMKRKIKWKKVMRSILTEVKTIEPVCEEKGTNEDDREQTTIQMIEHVDENRIDEVPSHLVIDDNQYNNIVSNNIGDGETKFAAY